MLPNCHGSPLRIILTVCLIGGLVCPLLIFSSSWNFSSSVIEDPVIKLLPNPNVSYLNSHSVKLPDVNGRYLNSQTVTSPDQNWRNLFTSNQDVKSPDPTEINLNSENVKPPDLNEKNLDNQNAKSPSDYAIDTSVLLTHIHKKCEKYGIQTASWKGIDDMRGASMPKAITILVPEYKILYVSNPKTGSTSFKKFILRLQGNQTPYDDMLHVHRSRDFQKLRDIDEYMPQYQNLTLREIIGEKLFNVGFLRNPMTRLISGFRNKVLRMEGGPINKQLQKVVPPKASDITRFKGFIHLITTGQIRDHHFTPQWNKMKVCSFPYSLLGQTETTHDNIATLMSATGIQGVEFPGSRIETGKDSKSTLEEVNEFMDPLTESEMKSLYKFYKMDFEILGYSKLDNPNFPYIDLN